MKYIYLPLLALLTGCEISGSHTLKPEYTDAKKMETELTALVKEAENISISGQAITENGNKRTQLEVVITNSPAIPKTAVKQQELARAIAKSLKSNLKNKHAYHTFDIQFVTEQHGIISSNTETVETIFENKDL